MTSYNNEAAEELYSKGMEFLKRGESLKALSCFEKSYRLQKTVRCQSYLGFCIAMERGNLKEGIALCEEAVSRDPEDPDLSLNLGKLLYKAGQKKEGIEAARKGLAFGLHEDTIRWLEGLGIRRKPAFPFLPRKHFINRYLGLFLDRLGIR